MKIGITMGDSSGVGPEILLKAFSQGELHGSFVVFGDREVLEVSNDRLGYRVPLHNAAGPSDARADVLSLVDLGIVKRDQLAPAKLSMLSGQAARAYVVAATQAALAREIDAMVTLPVNKEATQLTDPRFTGHTELIGELCGASDVTIMLVSDELIVTHVSTHVSLKDAIERVKRDRVLRIIQLTAGAVRALRSNPRIAVAGLNPHAGENGLFGDEDLREITPAVEAAKAQGLPVDGPFPPDTIFFHAVRKKKFDAIVCMYHDQGHVPMKLLDFENAVNVTLGLPIVRTSVDHGTAFDIAWTGVASTTSLVRAFDLAVKLAASASS